MADSQYHRHLLKHPVITSFLWMKWQRIRLKKLYFFSSVMVTTERLISISNRGTLKIENESDFIPEGIKDSKEELE